MSKFPPARKGAIDPEEAAETPQQEAQEAMMPDEAAIGAAKAKAYNTGRKRGLADPNKSGELNANFAKKRGPVKAAQPRPAKVRC